MGHRRGGRKSAFAGAAWPPVGPRSKMVSSLRGRPVALFSGGYAKQYSLPGFGWIWHDLAGLGGLVNPALGDVIALVDEVLAEGGGRPEIAGRRRKRHGNRSKMERIQSGRDVPALSQRRDASATLSFAFASFALFRGYIPEWPWAAREGRAWAGPRALARVPTMGA